MKENRFAIIVIVAYLLLVYVAWNDEIAQTGDGRTILTFWHTYNDQEEAVLKEIIAAWEKDNASWTIRPVRVPFDGHKPKLRTALTVKQGPDMARVDWSFVCELARKNAVVDLETFGFSGIRDQYLEAPLNTNLVDGVYRGLPDQTNCLVLFYNKDLFKKVGLDPEKPPTTWDELVEMGKTFKSVGAESPVYAFGMHNTVWWTLPFFNSWGARIISEDGKKCLLDQPAAIEAIKFKASLYAEHKIEGGAWRAGAITPDQGFLNGAYAMIFSGPWNLPQFKGAGLNFGVGLIPAGPAGSSSCVGGTNVVIFKDSKHAKPCYDFLVYFTSPKNQATWCSRLSQMPVNKGAFDLVKFSDPQLMTFLEQMKTTKANPVVTSFGTLEDIINPEMEAVLTGQKKPEVAMAEAARRVETRVLAP